MFKTARNEIQTRTSHDNTGMVRFTYYYSINTTLQDIQLCNEK